MKKVGIVTWNGVSNYGTILQAYALYFRIKSLGNTSPYLIKSLFKGKIDFVNIFKRILLELKKKISLAVGFSSKNSMKSIKLKKISEFVNSELIYSPLILTKKQLNNLVKGTDYFITGSDQIWNPYYMKGCFYLLDFVDDRTPKIAYASSIGVNEIPKKYHRIFKKYLSRFTYLALREKQGAELVSGITGRNDVRTVVDPTFLLDEYEWASFAKKADVHDIGEIVKTRYVLCYFVGKGSEYWEGVGRLQKQTGIDNVIVVALDNLPNKYNYHIYKSAGPREFVWLIMNSSLVCTDSFHATAFSINMKKDFVEFIRFKEGDKKSQNSRIYNLLERYGLEKQVYNNSNDIQSLQLPVNFMKSELILNDDRLDSLHYLKNTLK